MEAAERVTRAVLAQYAAHGVEVLVQTLTLTLTLMLTLTLTLP